MLRKIVSIKNVGRFATYGASGDVELKRYSLIFAENSRGKTTLCALLRSLQSGDRTHVIGRTTLGALGAGCGDSYNRRDDHVSPGRLECHRTRNRHFRLNLHLGKCLLWRRR